MNKEKKAIQLMKKHSKSFILFVILIAVICVGFAVGKHVIRGKNTKQRQTMRQVVTLKKRDLSKSVSVTGTIASADKRSVMTNLADTEIAKIAVEVGDYVKEGDTVIEFDDTALKETYETAENDYELNALKQNQTLKQAEDSVKEAKSSYDRGASEQADLVKGALSEYQKAKNEETDALAVYRKAQKATETAQKTYQEIKKNESKLKSALDKAQKENQQKQVALREAKEAYEAAESKIKYASTEDENYNSLNQKYKSAYDVYVQAKKEADEAKEKSQKAENAYSDVENAKKAYEQALKDENSAHAVYEAAASKTKEKLSAYRKAVKTQSETNEQNQEKLEDCEENYSIADKEASTNQENQSKQLKEAEEKLGKCVVTSPISGYITAINVKVGDTYNGTDTLFVVQDMSNKVVDATVDEYDIASLEEGQEAVVKTDATGDQELKGTLSYVALTPDESEGGEMGETSSSSDSAYRIQITLNDTPEEIKIGMTAKTSIILESVKDVFAVPYDCVETEKNGDSYITVLEDKNASDSRKIPVTVGVESDYYVEISGEELEEGMLVSSPETVGTSENTNSDSDSDQMPGAEMPEGGMPGGAMPGGDNGGRPGGKNSGNKGNGF